MTQYQMKFLEKSHHLKRRWYSRCFRGHNLPSRVQIFARFHVMIFLSDKILFFN